MASWNPTGYGGANWQGNANIATQRQLLSTSAGLYDDLLDFDFSTIKVSTLTVPNWISTSKLYVSDIEGFRVDISGVIIDSSGVFYAPVISSSKGDFTAIYNTSTFQLVFSPSFSGDFNVSFDLGLGQAIGGFLAGLGAAVGGGLIAVGTGAGLAIQGAEQGIGTIIAGRPQNYINNNVFETINFTSQLQVSTLGDANPLYSSIFRTVSSLSADSVPGREIFTSSFFYPGQICIRSASDPFNLITGDPQINSSTIQSFGQWVPLEGLEPSNIDAYSISTFNIQASNKAYFQEAEIPTLSNYNMTTSNLAVGLAANFAYNAGAVFDLGSSGDAAILGSINNWNFLTQQPINFFGQLGEPGSLTPDAILNLGTGAQSELYISSIYGTGFIGANTGYFSTLTVNELIVVSTFSTVYNVVNCNILSTSLVTANLVSTTNLEVAYISPFTFSSILGNPFGKYDISRFDSVQSTIYNQVSSLTQNILNYTLVESIQDQTSFNLNIAETPAGVLYKLNPQNVSQWGSSIMIFNDYQYGGTVELPYNSTFILAGLTGVFDLETQYSPLDPGYYANIQVVQDWIPQSEFSSFSTFLNLSGPDPPVSPPLGTWRFEIGSNGWIQSVQPNATPFITTNSNSLSITQDINDTTIAATDRLNLQAGEIFLKGVLNLTDINVQNIDTINLATSNAYISTLTALNANISTINASNITVNPLTGGYDSFYYKSSIGFNNPPTTLQTVNYTFKNDSPDFLPQFTLIPNFMGNNYFTSYNYTSWNNTVWNNTSVAAFEPKIYCGDIQDPLGTYAATFYINNTIASPAYALPVYYINSAGSNFLGNVTGGVWGKVQTANGTTWTFTNNVPSPQGSGGAFSNVFTMDQNTQYTQVLNNQNLQVQAPNTTLVTGTLYFNADQIRVGSRKYGTAESTTLPAFPIGIENNVYIDANISWTQVPPASGLWQSDATNAFTSLTGAFYYDFNSWQVQVIPSRFRTNDCPIYSWDVQPVVIGVAGSTGFCWGFSRYIQVNGGATGPGSGANNWNWYMAIPKNYTTN